MKHDPLDNSIKRHYDEQMLSEDRLTALLEASAESADDAKADIITLNYWERRWRNQRNISIAAGVMLLMLTSFIFQSFTDIKDAPLPLRVATEIALNHNKQLSAEFNVSDFSELGELMSKLDFVPAASSRLIKQGYSMQGARYCSIQGQLAAQIQMVDKLGNTATLYQTELSDKLQILKEGTHRTDGVIIRIWREGSRIFGLAKSI
jgi:hypothetical protein